VRRLTPVVVVLSATFANAGLAAAAALLTTSTSLKPPVSWAVTARSTPGRTSW